jgi:hypothetical protein
MNLKKKLVAAASLLAIGASSTAYAVPTTWTDTVDLTPDRYITPEIGFAYQHVLEDFDIGVDTVYEYSIAFNLYDDQDRNRETAVTWQPFLPGVWVPESVFFNLSGVESGGWTLAGRYELNSSGSLTLAVTSLLGDFYLGGSTLTARGDSKAVPEPTTLALFGAALLGFGLIRRKRTDA